VQRQLFDDTQENLSGQLPLVRAPGGEAKCRQVGCRRVPKALVAAAASTKVGQHAHDTAELFFDRARVPVVNLLGEEGTGFAQLVERLPQERLSIAVHAIASAAAAFDLTRAYCVQREAFGQPIGTFQHNRFTLAEMSTEIDIGQSYVDQQVLALNDRALTAEDAARAKWWCTEMSWRVLDRCLQLHGGYGYAEESPIARAWRDGRVPRIYGGTTEIMKEIVGRSLGF
jgi:alkylation response protein AidB-like acyl-CoA dehydrogenase